jgi:hypothetical protein
MAKTPRADKGNGQNGKGTKLDTYMNCCSLWFHVSRFCCLWIWAIVLQMLEFADVFVKYRICKLQEIAMK